MEKQSYMVYILDVLRNEEKYTYYILHPPEWRISIMGYILDAKEKFEGTHPRFYRNVFSWAQLRIWYGYGFWNLVFEYGYVYESAYKSLYQVWNHNGSWVPWDRIESI